jgi:hypothetical protein
MDLQQEGDLLENDEPTEGRRRRNQHWYDPDLEYQDARCPICRHILHPEVIAGQALFVCGCHPVRASPRTVSLPESSPAKEAA